MIRAENLTKIFGGKKALDFGEVLVKLLIKHRDNVGNVLFVLVSAVNDFAKALIVISYSVFQFKVL